MDQGRLLSRDGGRQRSIDRVSVSRLGVRGEEADERLDRGRWYEKQGFRRVGTFEVPDKWENGLLFTGWFYEMRL